MNRRSFLQSIFAAGVVPFVINDVDLMKDAYPVWRNGDFPSAAEISNRLEKAYCEIASLRQLKDPARIVNYTIETHKQIINSGRVA
jgi:hypothetical protein